MSPDGSQVLYGFAASGSEQTTLKVFDIASSQDLPDTIDRLESDYALPYWLPDGKSFVFSRRRKLPADAPPTEGYKFTQAFRHTIGDDPEQAELVFAAGAAGSPRWRRWTFPAVIVPLGSSWAIGQVKHGDETDISLYATPQASLGESKTQVDQGVRPRRPGDRALPSRRRHLPAHGADAPRFKVVRTSLGEPNFAAAAVVVPAGPIRRRFAVASRRMRSTSAFCEGVPNKILRVPYARAAVRSARVARR